MGVATHILLTTDFFLPAGRKNLLAAVSIVGMAGIIVFTRFFLRNKDTTPM